MTTRPRPTGAEEPPSGSDPAHRPAGRASGPVGVGAPEWGLVRRLVVALLVAGVVAVPVAVLAVLVERPGGAVARFDRAVAEALNRYAADHDWFVTGLEVVSTVGHPTTFRVTASVVAVWLLVVHRHRLALWTLFTTWGGALLGVLLKLLVARARPVLPESVSHADGYSFPSGHALSAAVGGVVLLMLVLTLRPPGRPALARWGWLVAVLVAGLVGFSRIGLGVHFVSDVVGGWLVGAGWVVTTTLVFATWWATTHHRQVDPTVEGLEPGIDRTGRSSG